MSQYFTSGGQIIGVSASASVLPINFLYGWTGLISLLSEALSRVQHHNSEVSILWMLSFLYGPTLTAVHDYWKNHSFDSIDLCQQNDVSDF